MKYNARLNIGTIALAAFVLCALMLAGFVWFALVLAVMVIGFGIPQSYELGESYIAVCSGLLRRRFPYAQMVQLEKIVPAENGDHDGAICIRLQSGRALRLTPRESAHFVHDLLERVPGLAVSHTASH